jgi:hypothetical protein
MLSTNVTAEEVIFNMKRGAVCAFDSSSIIYGQATNKEVKCYSVLNCIYSKDDSGELENI